VNDIQKGNTNVEINFYMGYNEEKGKSREDSLELRILYFTWVLGTPYYQGGYIGWVGEVQNIKIYLTTKIFCQAGHIRLLGRIPEALAGHVWASSLSRVNQAYPASYPGSRDLT
jgi:hypothetical protein